MYVVLGTAQKMYSLLIVLNVNACKIVKQLSASAEDRRCCDNNSEQFS